MSVEFTDVSGRTKKPKPDLSAVGKGFGGLFSDHMVTIKWHDENGWYAHELNYYAPLVLDPSSQVFHYGQEVFEGMKAFRSNDAIWVFRPFENARRMKRSCKRMAMPPLPEETFVAAIEKLVQADRDWVPSQPGQSLYLRPFMIATQPSLGFFRRSNAFLFVLIACPVDSYFAAGNSSLTVKTVYHFSRAAEGGTGAAKCGGNYAGSLLAQEDALEEGCSQIIWLDQRERKWVEELGTSNIFFVFGDKLVTPALTDTILDGINRRSIIQLAKALGYEVEERPISICECRDAAQSGQLSEAFSSGTSSTIVSIGNVRDENGDFMLGDGKEGKTTKILREELSGIQYGSRPDRFDWMHRIL